MQWGMQPHYLLIADDDDVIRWHLSFLITRNGGSVIYSAGSVEQIKNDTAINYGLIDIAIVDYDYGASRQTGIDLIAHLKKHGVRKVYLCTAFYDDDDVCREAKGVGADSIIPKPFEEEMIAALCSRRVCSEN